MPETGPLQPQTGPSAVRLGLSARWQLYGLIPVAIGVVAALLIGGGRINQGFILAVDLAFGVVMVIGVRTRVVIDGDRLVMRNSIRWKQIALDRLTEIKPFGGQGGPCVRLEDRGHHHCVIRLDPLRPHERELLHTELARRVEAGGVRVRGELAEILPSAKRKERD